MWSLFAVRPPVSRLSFSLSPSRTAAHLNSASTRLLLNDARPPCLTCGSDFLPNSVRPPVSVSLAVYRLLQNASRLLCLTCRGLHALPARPSLRAPSSQARHLLEVRTIVFWTLRFCVPLLLSFPPQSRSVDPSSHLVEHLLEDLHPLLLGHTRFL